VKVGGGGGSSVLILGVILLAIGYLTGIGILQTFGIILLVVGAVLWILGSMGRPVGVVGTTGRPVRATR
jgi:membrane protein implicated in regulation of membrane protease activity